MSRSSNSFTRTKKKKVKKHGWSGENITSGVFGSSSIYSGTPFGIGTFGGIRHFEKLKS